MIDNYDKLRALSFLIEDNDGVDADPEDLENDPDVQYAVSDVWSVAEDINAEDEERYWAFRLLGEYYLRMNKFDRLKECSEKSLPLAKDHEQKAFTCQRLFVASAGLHEEDELNLDLYEDFVEESFRGIMAGDGEVIALVLSGGLEDMEDHALLAAAHWKVQELYPAERVKTRERAKALFEHHISEFQKTHPALLVSSWGRIRRKYLKEITGIEVKLS